MNKPTLKHSKLPWQDNDAGLIYGQVSGDDNEAPFVCDVCVSPLEYTEQEKANAALIVRAVNSHGELEYACRLLVDAYARGEGSEHVDWSDIDMAHAAAQAALSQGGQP